MQTLESKDLRSSEKNLIVLDTNFLLDILRLPTEIAEKYIEAIEKTREYIFIPYIVGVEFHFNKKSVKVSIDNEIKKCKNKLFNNLQEAFLNSVSQLHFVRNNNQEKELKESLQNSFNELLENFKITVDDLFKSKYSSDLDILTENLVNLIDNSIADELTQDWIDEIQIKGEERYNKKVPPGYNDQKKAGQIRIYSGIEYDQQYGDYIVWEEILHRVSKESDNIGPKVIWVTSDGTSQSKNDIMFEVGGQKIGPHISLINELRNTRKSSDTLDNSDSQNEKVNKELYILSGFKFMQLANELSTDDAEQFRYSDNMILTSEEKDKLTYNQEIELVSTIGTPFLSHSDYLVALTSKIKQKELELAKLTQEVEGLKFDIIFELDDDEKSKLSNKKELLELEKYILENELHKLRLVKEIK